MPGRSSATTCTRCRARSLPASARRPCSPPGTRRFTSPRSTTCAWPRRCGTAATSTRRAKCCKSTAASGSWTSPMSFPASATELSVQARLSELVIGGSLELLPREMHRASEIAALLPTDTCVYIPSLPGLPLARTLEAVKAIRVAGLDPVPHLSARRILDEQEFDKFIKEAVRRYGVHRVLLLGGDEAKPKGPFS